MPSKNWRKFCAFALKTLGWTAVEPPVPEPKCIILGVPHTSIWDMLISYLYYTSVGGDAKVMIKSSAFFWPLGPILRAMGGVPMDREHPTKVTLDIIRHFKESDHFQLSMAPEGTRKAVKKWKTGYHTIAKAAGVPVYMGYFDWGTKRIGRGEKVELTDDARADTDRIQALYEAHHYVGKHPEGYLTH